MQPTDQFLYDRNIGLNSLKPSVAFDLQCKSNDWFLFKMQQLGWNDLNRLNLNNRGLFRISSSNFFETSWNNLTFLTKLFATRLTRQKSRRPFIFNFSSLTFNILKVPHVKHKFHKSSKYTKKGYKKRHPHILSKATVALVS